MSGPIPAMHVTGQPATDREAANARRAFGAIALATAVVLAIHASTVGSMVEIWHRSDTFAHGFLVVPAFLYLVWLKRADLAAITSRTYLPGLLAIVASGFVWLLAELTGTLAAAQFAVIALVPSVILTVFGRGWLKALLFPCAFLFFAVPFGEIFVPTLIDWTADFTIAALRLSGVPVYREGAHFVLPTGHWSVVEGCSGIRYLIASAVSGCLYAWLMYRSPVRRALFITAAFVVPLVANWLRAFLIVLVGHVSDNRIATGIDHLIYGWVFFGVIILILFAVGARWREDPAAPPAQPPTGRVNPSGVHAALVAVVALALAAWPVARSALATQGVDVRAPSPLQLPASTALAAAEAFTAWTPVVVGPTAQHVEYVRSGRAAGLRLALYRNQRQGAELVASGNRLVSDADPGWHVMSERTGRVVVGATEIEYRESLVRADRLLAVREWYQLRDRTTISATLAKFSLAADRLFMRDDTSAWVVAFTPVEAGLDDGRATLDAVMQDRAPAVAAALKEWAR